jgi:hypothetical protein
MKSSGCIKGRGLLDKHYSKFEKSPPLLSKYDERFHEEAQ